MGAGEIIAAVAVCLITYAAVVFFAGPWIWEAILLPLFEIIEDKYYWWRDAVEKLKKRRRDKHGTE